MWCRGKENISQVGNYQINKLYSQSAVTVVYFIIVLRFETCIQSAKHLSFIMSFKETLAALAPGSLGSLSCWINEFIWNLTRFYS